MSCPCQLPVDQPWRTRDTVWSPASFIGGLVVVAIGVAVLTVNPVAGAAILGVLAAAVVIAGIVQAARGHRRGCLVRRSVWFGVAAPGVPVRVLITLP